MKNMKKLNVLIALLLVFALIAACTQQPTQTPTTDVVPPEESAPVDDQPATGKKDVQDVLLGAIYRDMTQSWFIDEAAAAKAMAKELGIKDLLIGDAKEDPQTLADVLDNFIVQGIDGLIINIPDQQLSKMVVDKCDAAGIPVMSVDNPLVDSEGEYLAPAIILNGYLCGQTMGEWLQDYIDANNLMKNPDDVGVMIVALDQLSSCVPRADGQYDTFTKAYPDFPKDRIIRIDYGNGSTDEGYNSAAATITANPQVKRWFVMAGNDEGALGATRALEQAGLDKDAVVVGLGGYHAKDEFKKDFSCFVATAYIQASTVGNESVKAMVANITQGTPIFEEYKTDEAFGIFPFGAVMVTKENYKEIMGKDAE